MNTLARSREHHECWMPSNCAPSPLQPQHVPKTNQGETKGCIINKVKLKSPIYLQVKVQSCDWHYFQFEFGKAKYYSREKWQPQEHVKLIQNKHVHCFTLYLHHQPNIKQDQHYIIHTEHVKHPNEGPWKTPQLDYQILISMTRTILNPQCW